VLRFWETKFSFIRPMKRAGGRRFYRPQDIQVLRGIRRLLHDEGYTIKGVQRLHREEGVRRLISAGGGTVAGASAPGPSAAADVDDVGLNRLQAALADLEAVKARLDGLLRR
jgi:DNA-binding transcriptional MerR regulator